MSLQPDGDSLRAAVRWIGLERRARPEARVGALVDEASRKYDLSPAEAEFLLNLLARAPEGEPGAAPPAGAAS